MQVISPVPRSERNMTEGTGAGNRDHDQPESKTQTHRSCYQICCLVTAYSRSKMCFSHRPVDKKQVRKQTKNKAEGETEECEDPGRQGSSKSCPSVLTGAI